MSSLGHTDHNLPVTYQLAFSFRLRIEVRTAFPSFYDVLSPFLSIMRLVIIQNFTSIKEVGHMTFG
jgi:hypothetical protein